MAKEDVRWEHWLRGASFRSLRVHQLAHTGYGKNLSQNTLADLCLDLASFIAKSDRTVRSLHGNDDWLKEFTSPVSDGSGRARPEHLKMSVLEFDKTPDVFIEKLERYAADIRMRDIVEDQVRYVAFESEQLLRCWFAFLGKMLKVVGDSRTGEGKIKTEIEVLKRTTRLKLAVDGLNRLVGEYEDSSAAAANATLNFLEKNIENDQLIDAEIELSWQPERRRATVRILNGLDDNPCPPELLANILDNLRQLSNRPTPISATHHALQDNVIALAEMISGKKSSDYADAIQILRDVSVQRRQWKFLFDELERLRNELTYHKVIITCLEYRHVLENLPNRPEIMNRLGLKQLTKATPAWQYTWDYAVENEVTTMLQNHINAAAASAAGAPSAGCAAPAVQTPRPLTQLLQHDFAYWVQSNASTIRAMGSVAQVQKSIYEDWNSYKRGRSMYSELSGNIHAYGKTYDFKEDDWLKSDKFILSWLKPNVDAETGYVDWDQEWSNRGL